MVRTISDEAHREMLERNLKRYADVWRRLAASDKPAKASEEKPDGT